MLGEGGGGEKRGRAGGAGASVKIKQNQHILGLYGECILRKETDMKLIITLLFKLLF